MPEVDRLLAMALQAYEDSLCSSCGQSLKYAMDQDLLHEWTTMHPVRCGGCTALAEAAEANKDAKHPGALRFIIGLAEGWEKRLAAARAERSASDK
jgi:carbonic anhydrase